MTFASVLLCSAVVVSPERMLVSFVRTPNAPAVINLSDPSSTSMIGFQVDSENSIKLLNENCSWGYEMIRFQIMNPSGEVSEIKRKDRPWFKNVPSPMLVQPGETVMRQVKLHDGSWVGFPAGIAGQTNGWKIRAVLEIKNEFPLTNYGIWFGSAQSAWMPASW